jgi:hypothetical protein
LRGSSRRWECRPGRFSVSYRALPTALRQPLWRDVADVDFGVFYRRRNGVAGAGAALNQVRKSQSHGAGFIL